MAKVSLETWNDSNHPRRIHSHHINIINYINNVFSLYFSTRLLFSCKYLYRKSLEKAQAEFHKRRESKKINTAQRVGVKQFCLLFSPFIFILKASPARKQQRHRRLLVLLMKFLFEAAMNLKLSMSFLLKWN